MQLCTSTTKTVRYRVQYRSSFHFQNDIIQFFTILKNICKHICFVLAAVVDKVHRSSTWVKVQIRIIKYYSIKSKSTAFSILLEWKYKSTQFFMYLSKKVLIDRFILQFYIDYFISFYISTYFYNHTAQNTWVFPKITTIESRYIFCWYGLRWWEWCSNVHCEAYTAMYLRENRFHHLIFTSKKKVLELVVLQNVSYIWHEN